MNPSQEETEEWTLIENAEVYMSEELKEFIGYLPVVSQLECYHIAGKVTNGCIIPIRKHFSGLFYLQDPSDAIKLMPSVAVKTNNPRPFLTANKQAVLPYQRSFD